MKRFLIIFSILIFSCSYDKQETKRLESERNQEIVTVETNEWNYKAVISQQLNNLFDDVCTTEDLEFIDLYTALDSIAGDKYEKLVLVDSLKQKGFEVINWGRGNWQFGPRIVSLTLSNGKCDCQIDKLYYSTETNEKYKVTERIKCKNASR